MELPTCYRHPDRITGLACSRCGRPICGECAIDASVGQRCPECVRTEGTQKVIRGTGGGIAGFRRLAPATFGILAVTIVAYLLSQLGVVSWIDWAMNPYLVQLGEWWRLATSALLHGGIWHIGFNMYALYVIGPGLERALGTTRFVLAYLFAVVGGGAAVHFLGTPETFAVGASGGIFGLFGLWFASAWSTRHTPAGAAQFRSILSLLLINAAISLLPGISWQGHLGGFVAGVVTFAVARADRTGKAFVPVVAVLTVGLVVLTQLVDVVATPPF